MQSESGQDLKFFEKHAYVIRTGVLLAVLAALLGVMIFFYYIYPHSGIGKEQPVAFSHRVHATDKKIDCRFCHNLVDKSVNAGIPSIAKCFYCHNLIITQHPQIVKLKRYKDMNEPVPWVRVYNVPDHVRFSHKRHIAKNLDCTNCHGDIKAMDRITYTKFEMGFCVTCHREKEANLDCAACHK